MEVGNRVPPHLRMNQSLAERHAKGQYFSVLLRRMLHQVLLLDVDLRLSVQDSFAIAHQPKLNPIETRKAIPM